MKRAKRWALIFLAILVVMVGAIYWLAHARATRVFEENKSRIAELIAELKAEPRARLTLGPPADSGDARDIYASVVANIQALSSREDDVLASLDGGDWMTPTPTAAEKDAVLVKTAPWLKDLRAVLTAPQFTTSHRYDGAHDWVIKAIPDWQALSRISKAHIERHLARGEIEAALDLSVLHAAVGCDYVLDGAVIGLLVGTGITRVSINKLQEIIGKHPLSRERLHRLATEAEHLERSWRHPSHCWRSEEIWTRRMLGKVIKSEEDFMGEFGGEASPGWRYLFSWRIAVADALDRMPGQMGALRKGIELEPREAALAAADMSAGLEEEPNAVFKAISVLSPIVLRKPIECQMHLRLLRISVALARYEAEEGRPPARLEDLVPKYLPEIGLCPYTGKSFGYAPGKVWSIGGDGIDNHGTPLGEDDDIDDDGDVVWNIRRGP